MFQLNCVPIFNAFRVEAAASIAREPKLEIAATSIGGFWILNRSDSTISLKHGELFGFNIGSWAEVPSGHQGGSKGVPSYYYISQ